MRCLFLQVFFTNLLTREENLRLSIVQQQELLYMCFDSLFLPNFCLSWQDDQSSVQQTACEFFGLYFTSSGSLVIVQLKQAKNKIATERFTVRFWMTKNQVQVVYHLKAQFKYKQNICKNWSIC